MGSALRSRTVWLALLGVVLAGALIGAGARLWFRPAAPPPSVAPPKAQAAPALRGTVVRFVDGEAARAVLGAEDDWVRQTSDLQRALLMGRAPPTSIADFRAWQADAVQPWTPTERARWERALASIAPALDRLQLPWPSELLLIRTSGRESAEQPHTRANAVVLPQRFEQQGFSDAEVLAHELWHVLSRHQPALASRLYALIGYQPVRPLDWPSGWAVRRVANQDAPIERHAMPLKLQGRSTWVMPVVLVGAADGAKDGKGANAANGAGATLLERLEPRLLEVVPGGDGWPTQAVRQKGQPVWHEVDETKEFLDRLGGNTDYTLHPDETIADNFMFLVSGRSVKNPALLRQIESVLREPRKP